MTITTIRRELQEITRKLQKNYETPQEGSSEKYWEYHKTPKEESCQFCLKKKGSAIDQSVIKNDIFKF